jgi:hypothetical protein
MDRVSAQAAAWARERLLLQSLPGPVTGGVRQALVDRAAARTGAAVRGAGDSFIHGGWHAAAGRAEEAQAAHAGSLGRALVRNAAAGRAVVVRVASTHGGATGVGLTHFVIPLPGARPMRAVILSGALPVGPGGSEALDAAAGFADLEADGASGSDSDSNGFSEEEEEVDDDGDGPGDYDGLGGDAGSSEDGPSGDSSEGSEVDGGGSEDDSSLCAESDSSAGSEGSANDGGDGTSSSRGTGAGSEWGDAAPRSAGARARNSGPALARPAGVRIYGMAGHNSARVLRHNGPAMPPARVWLADTELDHALREPEAEGEAPL